MFADPSTRPGWTTENEAKRGGIAIRNGNTARQLCPPFPQDFGNQRLHERHPGHRVLGFAMLGAEAGEVVAIIQTAMLRRPSST
jgi:hypothetical protein